MAQVRFPTNAGRRAFLEVEACGLALGQSSLHDVRNAAVRPHERQFGQLTRVDLAGVLPQPLRGLFEEITYSDDLVHSPADRLGHTGAHVEQPGLPRPRFSDRLQAVVVVGSVA